jgi:hypothetical protein
VVGRGRRTGIVGRRGERQWRAWVQQAGHAQVRQHRRDDWGGGGVGVVALSTCPLSDEGSRAAMASANGVARQVRQPFAAGG